MRRFLLAAAVLTVSMPAQAQWGGGDGAQAGATAYCAARAAGRDDRQATRAASNALVNGMTGSFSSNIATIITGGSAMNDSLKYLIQRQCPELLTGGSTNSVPVQARPTDPAALESWCNNNPWEKECGGQNPDKATCYGCEEQVKPVTPVSTNEVKHSAIQENKKKAEATAHNACLKASDYVGCMKYQLSK
jgi:hypothetical protein